MVLRIIESIREVIWKDYGLEQNKRAMGVRVPIEGPLDYGEFPLSKMPETKTLLADADNILG